MFPTHQLGKGFPDLVVAKDGINYLIEIKDGAKPPSERKLTPDEEKFHKEWSGAIFIIETLDDVLKFHKGHVILYHSLGPSGGTEVLVSIENQ